MAAGWINLAYFMGLLSVNLGILNLLPVPVLDGGHLLFLGIEAVRRRPVSERVQIAAQQVGMALLASLMLLSSTMTWSGSLPDERWVTPDPGH